MPNSPSVRVYETASTAETTQLGRTLGERLQPGDTVLLIGDLGAGKTCFIQGLCSGLGVEEPVTSPTFTLINEYQGRLPVAHFDLYRLNDPESVLDIGFDEYMNLVLDDACEVQMKNKTRKHMGRILMKGDNITFIQSVDLKS